jgi:ABC-2 type transport system ATP-binding protein
VGLAKAMLNQPRLLLLDEPTASIDPASARDIRQTIRSFARDAEVGVLWTSHNMYEVEEVCDHVMFLSQGEIILEGDPKELPAQYGKRTLEDLFVSVAREPMDLGALNA